ncbi:hypothetical protein [Leptonema illini]|uniref:Uncharacterized protein n=1 Tax=Leptonema illini DSM 21528 TaxID=929563 RepID=H2CGR1_9LEPT|nr:hypothetical protein [Leptonema illini]EHQ04737.1 hypothetical protein Lepil_0026 [Leptonema illini DSM 21528]
MTIQFSDSIQYESHLYHLSRSVPLLSAPEAAFPFSPVSHSSANVKGYLAEYAILDGRLTLSNLNISATYLDYLRSKIKQTHGKNHKQYIVENEDRSITCKNLGTFIDYTGILIIARTTSDATFELKATSPRDVWSDLLLIEFKAGLINSVKDCLSMSIELPEVEKFDSLLVGARSKRYIDRIIETHDSGT